jgi:formate hydrogenlyase subunit 3/multisubunit Na+/H+ antiporter MnhD subunit
MLLNFTWLIPGLPIIASIFIALLLFCFSKTMNRLTKPISYFLIVSLIFSEIINFIFFKRNISGNNFLFGSNFQLVVDREGLLFSELIGLLFLFIMVFSFAKLQRRNGYVRYFISLGLLSGLIYLFSFSGSLFHNFYDPLISSLNNLGISF